MQRGLPQMPIDWDYGSISTLLSALHARKLSASELIEHTIARIEALDGRINAVVVRDFDRARNAAPPRRYRTGPRRAAAIARHPRDAERTVQRRRPADDMGLSAFQRFPT